MAIEHPKTVDRDAPLRDLALLPRQGPAGAGLRVRVAGTPSPVAFGRPAPPGSTPTQAGGAAQAPCLLLTISPASVVEVGADALPLLVSSSAMARPIPESAPVTIAVSYRGRFAWRLS